MFRALWAVFRNEKYKKNEVVNLWESLCTEGEKKKPPITRNRLLHFRNGCLNLWTDRAREGTYPARSGCGRQGRSRHIQGRCRWWLPAGCRCRRCVRAANEHEFDPWSPRSSPHHLGGSGGAVTTLFKTEEGHPTATVHQSECFEVVGVRDGLATGVMRAASEQPRVEQE